MDLEIEVYYCYLLTNKNRTVLYVGYTNNLKRRMSQHINGLASKFTKKYSVVDLIYYEILNTENEAKDRERQLKNWHKEWKWNLVKVENPNLKTIKLKRH